VLESPANAFLATDKVPKLVVFPVEAIVTYWIVLTKVGVLSLPPPKTPRVEDEQAPNCSIAADKSPKSVAAPRETMVT
jgi:hypothetical protein